MADQDRTDKTDETGIPLSFKVIAGLMLVVLVIGSIAMAIAFAPDALIRGYGGEQEADDCASNDGALNNAGFIFVEDPRSGERVSSGFEVRGCSSTFEASVNWRLRDRTGKVLASGVTQGGNLQPGSFEFTAEYSVAARQIGELEVFEPRVTGEGFLPPRNVVPLVLQP
jgi:hypothetical protein